MDFSYLEIEQKVLNSPHYSTIINTRHCCAACLTKNQYPELRDSSVSKVINLCSSLEMRRQEDF